MPSSSSNKREFIKSKRGDGTMSPRDRRIQLSVQIRKAKQSQLLSLKRKCYSSAAPSSDGLKEKSLVGLEAIAQLASNFISNKQPNSLHALQNAISNSDAVDYLLQFFTTNDGDTSSALFFINTLASLLLFDGNSNSDRLDSAKVLTNLAASGGKDDKDDDLIYGGTVNMKGWCYVIISSNSLYALVEVISNFCCYTKSSSNSNNNSNNDTVSLCEQCCWAVANIAGDSHRCRMVLLETMASSGVAVPSLLVNVLQIGIAIQSAGLCRNSIWAICNILRGSPTTLSAFLVDGNNNLLLHPSNVIHLLLAPEILSSSSHQQHQQHVPWNDVVSEACWMLLFLTSKEDEAVHYLCNSDTNIDSHPSYSIFQALEIRLRVATENIIMNDTSSMLQQDYCTRSSGGSSAIIPCIRAVSNIATACNGRYVPHLIQCSAILQSLATLIENGVFSNGGSSNSADTLTISLEAAWSAGSMLLFCHAAAADDDDDESLQQSSAAYQVLVPALCNALTSNTAVLALKREAISSLVDAVSLPSSQTDENKNAVLVDIRNTTLRGILTVDNMIPVITKLLTTTDIEAVVMALHIVNMSFRRLNLQQGERRLIRQTFEECSILDALESICDRVVSIKSATSCNNSNLSSFAAEMAADLIDDFFSDEDVLPGEEDLMLDQSSASFFKFGVNQETPFIWNISRSNENNNSVDVSAALLNHESVSISDIPEAAIMQESSSTISSRGRGRGRGISNTPAWMQQQQNQEALRCYHTEQH